MTATKSAPRASRKRPGAPDLKQAYIDYVLEEGKRPASVYKFCRELGLKESDFYTTAGSFRALENLIWNDFAEKTINRLQGDAEYGQFTAREKLLTFYFALFEELKSRRSFVVFTLRPTLTPRALPPCLRLFRKSFKTFINGLISQGKEQGEIAMRPYVEKTYPELFWMQLSFLMLFWINDESPGFERTDAAIEKSVNLAFELVGKGAVDAALDFARFVFQQGVN
ncbi:MAG: hypothetical protein KatS3mg032_0190 [Cyclobacteriaceae bacterium]|nr:MAG: hypothetical protein KatS3mg032_0190 [Cyclobacteriaceae bacterium]